MRDPIHVTSDRFTAWRLSAVAVASYLDPRMSWPLYVGAAGGGALLSVAVQAPGEPLVALAGVAALAAVTFAATVALVMVVNTQRSFRRMASPGQVLSSGYDEVPRLVVTSGVGVSGIEAGSVRQVTRTAGVAVLHMRSNRRRKLLVLGALVTPADETFLVAGACVPRGTTPHRHAAASSPGPLPTIEITDADQRGIAAARVTAWRLQKALWVLITGAVVALMAAVVAGEPVIWVGATAVLAAAAVKPFLISRSVRRQWPLGQPVGAALHGDGLVLQQSHETHRVQLSAFAASRLSRDTLSLRHPNGTAMHLPRRLLPDEAVASIQASVGARF